MRSIHNKLVKKELQGFTTKYADIKSKQNIKVSLIMGISNHRYTMYFNDGTSYVQHITTSNNSIYLHNPRLDKHTLEKLAVLTYLTDLIFFNDNFIVEEHKSFYTYDDYIKNYRNNKVIEQIDSYVYSLDCASLDEKDFIEYDIQIIQKQAKIFNFDSIKL